MTKEEFKNLSRGDIIRHKIGTGDSYLIDANYGGHCTAVVTKDVTNPDEWDIIFKAKLKKVIN